MWDGRIFLKNLRNASIKKEVSNEPNFGQSTRWTLDSTFKGMTGDFVSDWNDTLAWVAVSTVLFKQKHLGYSISKKSNI
jgi:hypothetical protein